jgi:hypothetical protein
VCRLVVVDVGNGVPGVTVPEDPSNQHPGWLQMEMPMTANVDYVDALLPVFRARLGDRASHPELAMEMIAVSLADIPEEVMSSEIADAVRETCEELAGTLDLFGQATIQAYVNRHSGQMVVTDINTVPDLNLKGPLLRQVGALSFGACIF